MPGVSIALIRDGKLAWQRGFGVKDTGTNEPVDNETVFAACSDTKPVFAYAVMKLCEKGMMNLDTPLTKYTSKRLLADPRLDLITARHVLNHTTGFPNWRNGKELKIEFTPGEKYQYSGEGFSYLQSVVEQVSGQPFEDFMRTNILVPFGMTSSQFGFDVANPPQLAKPHDPAGKRMAEKYYKLPSAAEKAEGLATYGAAAMLMTTPSDYAKFLLEIVNPKPPDAFRLNEASRQEMLRPRGKRGEKDNVEQWGSLGWSIIQMKDGPTFFTHAGQDAGYYCTAAASVERKAGLMIMMNGDNYEAFQAKMIPNLLDFAKRFFA